MMLFSENPIKLQLLRFLSGYKQFETLKGVWGVYTIGLAGYKHPRHPEV